MAKDKKSKKNKKDKEELKKKKKKVEKKKDKNGRKKDKKKKKKEGKSKDKSLKNIVEQPQTTENKTKTRKSAATGELAKVTSDECSAKYTVKIAISRLRRLQTAKEVKSFMKGETRVTILRVAEDKLSSLS